MSELFGENPMAQESLPGLTDVFEWDKLVFGESVDSGGHFLVDASRTIADIYEEGEISAELEESCFFGDSRMIELAGSENTEQSIVYDEAYFDTLVNNFFDDDVMDNNSRNEAGANDDGIDTNG
jgi:hypothetical protein